MFTLVQVHGREIDGSIGLEVRQIPDSTEAIELI